MDQLFRYIFPLAHHNQNNGMEVRNNAVRKTAFAVVVVMLFMASPVVFRETLRKHFPIGYTVLQTFNETLFAVFASKEKEQDLDPNETYMEKVNVFDNTLTYTNEDKAVINIADAAQIVNSLKYTHYQEKNLCDVMEGLTQYDKLIELLGKELKLSEEMQESLKLSKYTDGRMRAVESFSQLQKDGSLVYGRFATVRRELKNGKTKYDIAYSIHSLSYKLADDNSKDSVSFWNKFVEGGEKTKSYEDGFYAYFQNKAIEKFNRQCSKLLKRGTAPILLTETPGGQAEASKAS